MKEFKVIPPNDAMLRGLYELEDGIKELSKYMYISPADKARAIAAYKSGEQYHFNFQYGDAIGTVSAYRL